MPHTSYALFKAIRSHQIDSPRVDANRAQHPAQRLQPLPPRPHPRMDRPTPHRLVRPASRSELTGSDTIGHLSRARCTGCWPATRASGCHRRLALRLGIRSQGVGEGLGDRLDGSPIDLRSLEDPYSAVRWIGWQSLKTLPDVSRHSTTTSTAPGRTPTHGDRRATDPRFKSKEPVPTETTPVRREILSPTRRSNRPEADSRS